MALEAKTSAENVEVPEEIRVSTEDLLERGEQQLKPYLDDLKESWNDGLSLEEAMATGVKNEDGTKSIELCELSAKGLVNFVGGAATTGALIPLVAGNSMVLLATAAGTAITIAPAVDPILTTAATTVAVMYGALKVYCAKDQRLDNQAIEDFIALVNQYADESEEAIQRMYDSVRAQLDSEEITE